MRSDRLYKEYDICVITAANDYQAQGYREQIRWRIDKGILPEKTEFLVFADPGGKRIGSGGSTIYVLYKLLERFCHDHRSDALREPFVGKRILILHSGGDSRRLPAYSAVGKIFIPLPTGYSPAFRQGRGTDKFVVTLFDLLLDNLMGLPFLTDGQVVIASGDVLLSFHASEVAFSDWGVTSLAYPGPVEVASNHGVYIPSQAQLGENLRKVRDFLQKPTYDELKECDGLDAADRAFIDTGVMSFGLDAVEALMSAAGVSVEAGRAVVEKEGLCQSLINADARLDLYKEIPFAMLGVDLSATEFHRKAQSRTCCQLVGEGSAGASGNPCEFVASFPSFADALKQVPFSVCLLPYCEFLHVGTSKNLIQNFHTVSHMASIYRFQNFSRTKIADRSGVGDAFIYNSLIDTHSIEVGGVSLIEGCCLDGRIQIGGENILTSIPEAVGDIKLQRGICITCLPVHLEHTHSPATEYAASFAEVEHAPRVSASPRPPISPSPQKGWVSIIYGIEDDFKKLAEDSTATFLNEAFLSWMEERGITAGDIWAEDEPKGLWNARLFPFSAYPAQSMQIALSIQNHPISLSPPLPSPRPSPPQLENWRRSFRMSLREILGSVDYKRFLENCSSLYQRINLENLGTIFTPGSNLSSEEILSWCRGTGGYAKAAEVMLSLIEQTQDLLFQARLCKLLSNILREACERKVVSEQGEWAEVLKGAIHRNSQKDTEEFREFLCKPLASENPYAISWQNLSESLEDRAFELIGKAIAEGLKNSIDSSNHRPVRPRIQIRPDEVVWICAPARFDFAGGWSDTPPYCLEHGGSVLNAAVKLNGQYPIQVIGKLHAEPCIRINSIDLGERIIISEISDLLSYRDPSDWSALPKAAFAATGIIPDDTGLCLQDVLEKLGGGIDMTLFSAVPAGSGLGTSSILGSAVIACLSRMIGRELAREDLFNLTLYMEQLMTTGGGWQDQIGGVVGGVKHIQTEPGLFQVPRISWTDLRASPDMDLSERFLLYYTGYRRMAKNILRSIVGRYLDRDPVTVEAIARLRGKALELKEELDHRNIDAFGKKIAEVWELNKTLDPGTSNEKIESILSRISHLFHGAKLLGAGGGGFLFIVTKGPEQAQQIRKILTENPPNNRARFFDFGIDPNGLKVSVL